MSIVRPCSVADQEAGTRCVGALVEQVQVGSVVRIRNMLAPRPGFNPAGVSRDTGAELPIAIVEPGAPVREGLRRLTPRMPLGAALLGHRVGDVVRVQLQKMDASFEVLAIYGTAAVVPVPATGSPANDETVRIGSVVRVRDGDLLEWWRIVPPEEADALQRRLSVAAPLARALLGHRVDDQVPVQRPGDRSPVTILAVDAVGCWE
jgi:transcription elongation GreA/GreB family factor